MATKTTKKTLVFRDLGDRSQIKIDRPGTYYFGLSTEGSLYVEPDEDALCVKLFQVTLQFDGGCTLAPINRDLTCKLNSSEDLTREINLMNGTTLEIAEKRLLFLDGSAPSPRRHLPQTPGQSRQALPPPKPARTFGQTPDSQLAVTSSQPDQVTSRRQEVEEETDSEDEEKKWIAGSYLMSDLALDHQEKLNNLKTPEQISILAASYFSKQLRMFTDATISGDLIDGIFRLFMDTVEDCKDSFMTYLVSVSQRIAKDLERRHHRPMHKPAVRLATDLLRSCFEPISCVTLIMSLLRTFSHFDGNLSTMVRHQTPAAVLGCLTAFQMSEEIQQHGLDILAKLSLYQIEVGGKPPLKEVAVEQVIRAVKQHPDVETISWAACRVFANLSSTLTTLLNEWLDKGVIDTQEKLEFMGRIELLQDFIFKEGLPVAQTIVEKFQQNLGANMDFRRFVRFYAIYQQYKSKKTKWLSETSLECTGLSESSPFDESFVMVTGIKPQTDINGNNNNKTAGSQKVGKTSVIGKGNRLSRSNGMKCNSKVNTLNKGNGNMPASNGNQSRNDNKMDQGRGILKKSRSYECLKTSERKLNFDSDTFGGSDSDSSSFSSDSSFISGFGFPFETEIPLEVEMDADFSHELVKHLFKKARKSQKRPTEYDSFSSDDESDKEFLYSIDHHVKTKHRKKYKPPNNGNSNTGAEILRVSEKGHQPCERSEYDGESCGTSSTSRLSTDSTTDSLTESFNVVTLHDEKSNPKVDDEDTFLEKLLQSQIVTYVVEMVFQDENAKVLEIIDHTIQVLLQEIGTCKYLLQFAEKKYGANMTLMDLEPGLVIKVIDAVKYRTVAIDLLHSTLVSLTAAVSTHLQTTTLQTVLDFYKDVFSKPSLTSSLKDVAFLREFIKLFQEIQLADQVEVPVELESFLND